MMEIKQFYIMRKGKLSVSSTKYTLDRYEGDYAIFLQSNNENAQKIIHRSEMKEVIHEGDIVLIDYGPALNIRVLKRETTKQRENVKALLEKLKNRK